MSNKVLRRNLDFERRPIDLLALLAIPPYVYWVVRMSVHDPLISMAIGGLNVCAFILYAYDKTCAKRGWYRAPESLLHLLSVLGAWPGAFVAQQLFRHKTQKMAFRWVFLFSIILNLMLVYFIHQQLTP